MNSRDTAIPTAASQNAPAITLKQVALLQRRREKLQEATQELESLLAGRNTALAQLGAETAAEQRTLADRLARAYARNEAIDRLKEQGLFARYQQLPLNEAPLATAPESAIVLPFFYCAVRLASGTPWYAGTVEDVAQLAASAQSRAANPRALLLDELCDTTDYLAEGVPRPDDFFAMMDDVYQVLAGTPIADAIPPHLREMVASPYQQALDEAAWAGLPLMSPQQLDEAVASGQLDADLVQQNRAAFEAQWNQLLDEAQRHSSWETDAMTAAEQESQRQHRRIAGQLEAWRDSFSDADEFCQQYLNLREEVFEGEGYPDNFANLASRAAETLLAQEGLSQLARKDTVDEAIYLLGKIKSRLTARACHE